MSITSYHLSTKVCFSPALRGYWNRGFLSVVYNSGKMMALRAILFINFHRTFGHFTTKALSGSYVGLFWKQNHNKSAKTKNGESDPKTAPWFLAWFPNFVRICMSPWQKKIPNVGLPESLLACMLTKILDKLLGFDLAATPRA